MGNIFQHYRRRRGSRERLESLKTEKQTVWSDLITAPADLTLLKNRYSALISGSSALERTLRGMSIDTVLIAGTKTNVCCKSTARDAMMLDFKVVLVEDCARPTPTTSTKVRWRTSFSSSAMS